MINSILACNFFSYSQKATIYMYALMPTTEAKTKKNKKESIHLYLKGFFHSISTDVSHTYGLQKKNEAIK